MALQFKIILNGISKPSVWRKIIVPEEFTFYQMHQVIQTAFGWKNTHLFFFSPNGYNSEPTISLPGDWGDDFFIDCRTIRVSRPFTEPQQELMYIYDLGDNWVHSMILEEITDQHITQADCIDGQGRCPPDDCGGPGGYAELKRIMKFAGHQRYEEMREWLEIPPGYGWNAEKFDLESTRTAVQKIA